MIDLREQVVSFRPQPVITEDNLVVEIDTVLYFQVTDARAAAYEIANFLQAVEQLTVTTLRNVVGSMDLERTLTSRDTINSQLRGVLDEATGKWGLRVNRVEIKAIYLPQSIKDAMEKQMRAERDKRWQPSRAPKANANLRSSPPRVTSRPPSCAPRATGPQRSSRPRARPALSTRYFSPCTATTPTPKCSPISISRCCRSWPRARETRSGSFQARSPPPCRTCPAPSPQQALPKSSATREASSDDLAAHAAADAALAAQAAADALEGAAEANGYESASPSRP